MLHAFELNRQKNNNHILTPAVGPAEINADLEKKIKNTGRCETNALSWVKLFQKCEEEIVVSLLTAIFKMDLSVNLLVWLRTKLQRNSSPQN